MEFDFSEIEKKWSKEWEKNGTYKVTEDPTKPKYYVLDMFPYPSGAGLHVGHPLGYVASDIYARYKRLKGFNVLHPMGYDAFGLPAEQYAIETGTHPRDTTFKAIDRYKEQLDKIGFSYDWDRKVVTCEPDYYKWTQWIFLKLFNSWYNRETNRAEPIETLIQKLTVDGCQLSENAVSRTGNQQLATDNRNWKDLSETEQQELLMNYRLAFQSFTEVNWCDALGCVLANDEVKDGKSERGGYPVERRKMKQWSLRITEYADRLLEGLERLDWSDSMKDMQRNWIGRSEGAIVRFNLSQTLSEGEGLNSQSQNPKYFTTDGQTWSTSIINAKDMRQNPTEAEEIVWNRLKASQLDYKFRRQHPIDKFIVDFVCLKKGLVVEIDGKIHDLQKGEDAERTKQLERYGFTVIRFSNEQVIANIDDVINQIKSALEKQSERNLTQNLSEADGINTVQVAVEVPPSEGFREVEVFTTRVDTLFGVTFLVIAPEHELIDSLITSEQKEEMEKYIAYVKSRSDIERQQEKKITGCFTGSYAVHPFTQKQIPIWTAEYVLAGYGTGAIMAVPADDERDRKFAEKFGLPIIEVIDKSMHAGATIEDKVGKMINSDFLNGMEVLDAIQLMLSKVEELGIGTRKVNYKFRDSSFSRQRYWGEPIPMKYKVVGEPDAPIGGESDDIPYPLSESELPLVLPSVDSFKPSGDGRSPLANSKEWVAKNLETDTMPGYAGSSWYFLRYMDAKNDKEFAAKEKIDYWQNVDIYFGGAEHAVGHLLYARFWNKFLYDLGYVPKDEPFQKLVNQGMIQGRSSLMIRVDFLSRKVNYDGEIYLSLELVNKLSELKLQGLVEFINQQKGVIIGEPIIEEDEEIGVLSFTPIHIDVNIVNNDYLNVSEAMSILSNRGRKSLFITYNEKFICQSEVEKMSKSKYNVVNPDDVIAKYGADCLRMFEMFLGPLEQSKPWDDKGISGVSNFLRRFWRMFYDEGKQKWNTETATPAELKILHKTLKKVTEDIERLSFNTAVSAFMICVNELNDLKCTKRKILEPLVIALAPFAPFMTEELWSLLGNASSVHQQQFPATEEKYLVESEFLYPVSINGKVRANISFALDLSEQNIKQAVLENETISKWTEGKEPKKFIFVKGKIINVVI